jgi:sugar lactone lactonase YvrE
MLSRILFPAIFLCLLLPGLSFAQQAPYLHEASIVRDEEEHLLASPTGVLSDPVMDEIYVLSQSRIIIYTSDLFPLFTLDRGRGIESPVGIAVDKEGNLFVSQAPLKGGNPNYRISVYNACLRLVREIPVKDLGMDESFHPFRLALDSKGNLYVTSQFYPGVVVVDKNGKKIDTIVPMEKDKKIYINDVKIDDNDRIYLLSADMGRVYVYDQDRKLLFRYGSKGGSTGFLSRPVGMGIDAHTGRTFLVDYMRHSVLAYDKNGKYIFEFGGLGVSHGWFQFPWDIAVDKSGRVIVADSFNNRVEIFKSNLPNGNGNGNGESKKGTPDIKAGTPEKNTAMPEIKISAK